MGLPAIRSPMTTARYEKNSVVLNEAFVSVLRRRTLLERAPLWVSKSAASTCGAVWVLLEVLLGLEWGYAGLTQGACTDADADTSPAEVHRRATLVEALPYELSPIGTAPKQLARAAQKLR